MFVLFLLRAQAQKRLTDSSIPIIPINHGEIDG
jgi:hypothetical protein